MPPPEYDTIVEPFAGSAAYSVVHGAGKRVILYDLDPQVVAIWKYLIRVSPEEILDLPGSELGSQDIRTLDIHPTARLLIQRWLTPQGSNSNWRMPPSCLDVRDRHPGSYWSTQVRDRLAREVTLIRNWEVHEASWVTAPLDLEATWVFDPPYQHNKEDKYAKIEVLDYEVLASTVQSVKGQVYVHEQEGANWLPFEPFVLAPTGHYTVKDGRTKRQEVLWTNKPFSPPVLPEF